MNSRIKTANRGQILKEIVKESGIGIPKLMKDTGYKNRASYYAHVAKSDLSLDILMKYAKALKYDLREHFPEMNHLLTDDPAIQYTKPPETFEDALSHTAYWRDKYYAILEKYTRLMETRQVTEK